MCIGIPPDILPTVVTFLQDQWLIIIVAENAV